MGRTKDGVFPGARQMRASVPAEDGVLVRILMKSIRARYMSTDESGGHRNATARRPTTGRNDGQEVMETINQARTARPARDARLFDESCRGGARPTPYRTPVLPRGWAPLTLEQQRAVLEACDAAPNQLTFRLGSLVDPEVDYRVYQLQKESWAGLWVAARCLTDCDGVVSNRDLLGLGLEPLRAVRITLDFFNSDLQARGESWRLGVESLAVPQGDPRRV